MAIINPFIVLSPLLVLTVHTSSIESSSLSLQSFNRSSSIELDQINAEVDKKPKRSSTCRGDGRRDANGGKCGLTRSSVG